MADNLKNFATPLAVALRMLHEDKLSKLIEDGHHAVAAGILVDAAKHLIVAAMALTICAKPLTQEQKDALK